MRSDAVSLQRQHGVPIVFALLGRKNNYFKFTAARVIAGMASMGLYLGLFLNNTIISKQHCKELLCRIRLQVVCDHVLGAQVMNLVSLSK